MALFNLANITAALADTKESGVSFAGLAKKWETVQDVTDLIAAINDCKNLQFLDLEGNTLGIECAKEIGEALKKHPEFKKALFKDLFTGRMKTEIPLALESLGLGMSAANAHLTVLDCSDNALGPNGMAGLVRLIKSSTCYSLQELKLNNCGLGITGAKMLAESLTINYNDSVKAGTPLELKVFVAGRNRLENEGAKALSAIFGKIGTLEEISIPQNGIYHVGMTALSQALRENKNIQILNLNDNTIGPIGALALSDAFYSVQSIKEINFGDCLLKNKGGLSLSEALADGHPDLEVLNLSANEIGPEVGEALADAMSNKMHLRQFILDSNQFGEEGVEIIQNIMDRNNHLEALVLEEDEGLLTDNEDSAGSGDEEQEDEEEEEGDEEEEEDDGEHSYVDSDDVEEGEFFIGVNTTVNETFETSLDRSFTNGSGEAPEPDSVAAFCQHQKPTFEMFAQIQEDDKVAAFREYLLGASEDDYLIYLVFTILKCSSVSENSKDALTLSQELFKDAFEYAKNNNRMKSLRNFFLIQLGLLKSEEKQFNPTFNVKACRAALSNAIKHNALPDDEKNIFEVFLNAAN
ncbi:unnamed protein product [Diamesa serratosioi]